jgi:hypothetical protein
MSRYGTQAAVSQKGLVLKNRDEGIGLAASPRSGRQLLYTIENVLPSTSLGRGRVLLAGEGAR